VYKSSFVGLGGEKWLKQTYNGTGEVGTPGFVEIIRQLQELKKVGLLWHEF
jgi:lipid A disaccharide synthetase